MSRTLEVSRVLCDVSSRDLDLARTINSYTAYKPDFVRGLVPLHQKPSSPLVVSDQDGTLPLPVVRLVQTLQMFSSFKLELDTG